jgi:hypothetical protein
VTGSTPLELNDRLIERMLAARARGDAPATLVPDIMFVVASTPQRSRLLWPLSVPRLTGPRALLIAAAIGLAALGVAASLFGTPRNNAVLPPNTTPAPSIRVVPSASASATASAASESAPPNSRLIVYQFGADAVDLFTLDPATGQKTLLGNLQKTTGPSGQTIHWSADRRRAIVFGDSDSALAIVDLAQGSVDGLASLSPSPSRDNLSPSADRIARIAGDNGSVAIVRLDGVEVAHVDLRAGLQPFLNMAWAPDESSVLVSGCLPCSKDVSSASNVGHLYVAPLDGRPLREIATASGDSFLSPQWAPDMTAIVFTDARGLAVYRAADGHITQLPGGPRVNNPVWSPDGRRIAFARVGARAGIYTLNPDGTGLTQLTSGGADPVGDGDPNWSPDSHWLLFTRGASAESLGDLWIVASDGGEPRLLERNAVADW